MSNVEDLIPAYILELPISVLAIPSKTQSHLRKARINTIREIFIERENGLEDIRFIGEKSANQINDALVAFLQETNDLDEEKLNALIDPRPLLINIDGDHLPNLVTLITPFSKKLLVNLQKERDYEVIRHRYGLDGSDTYTLQEVGDYFGFERERARQLESRGIQFVKNALYQNPTQFKWQVPVSITQEATELYEILLSGDDIQTENEICNIIKARYTFAISDNEINALRFLLSVYGFKPLPKRATGSSVGYREAWHIKNKINKAELYQASKSVHRVLMNSGRAMSLFELTSQVNKRRKKKLGVTYIRYALKLCNQIEVTENESYQIKLEHLPSLADKAYRVLYDANQPLHYRGIWKEVNHRLVKAGYPADAQIRSITGQLADRKFAKDRFVHIGRGGYWSLSEWEDIRNETIIELMKEFFHLRQTKATPDEVYEYVASRRPEVSKQSIYTYISTKKETFIKVAEKQYELTAWGGKEYKVVRGIGTKRKTMNVIRDIYTEKDVQTMPYSELIKELALRLGLAESTVRNRISNLPIIKLQKDPTARNYQAKRAVFTGVDEIEERTRKPRQSKKTTVRDKVQKEISDFLHQQPGEEALVADVATAVIRTTGCKRPTFYRYLSEMDGVAKREFQNRVYCYLKQDTTSNTLAFPKIQLVEDPILKENLTLATKNLNVDNVDNGLFQLGKLFENELKSYLLEVRSKAVFNVTRSDLTRLVDMIDCIERNGIVKNKHHLTFLRQERNTHAHEDMPTLQERQRLLEQAPFLGGLFVDYITFFHEKRKKIS